MESGAAYDIVPTGYRIARQRRERVLQPMANQTWQFREFPAPNGEQAAVTFLNEPARQGPGEASGFVRNDGSAVVVYLEPGTG